MNGSWNRPRTRLAELSATHPELAPHLTREMALRARRFMNGITLYRHHPARRPDESAPVVWQSGTTVLRDYASHAIGAPVALVVPSLINRFTILDLQPGHSLLHTLARQGLRPLVIDWNLPGEAERAFSLGDYVTRRLIPALHVVATAGPAHIVGYCMGGLLALALAALRPGLTRTLSLLATPWDFHAGFAAAGQDGVALERALQPWLAGDDPVPVDVIQGVFNGLQPMHALRKFSSFAVRDHTAPEAERFVLTEDWLNDGVDLTAAAARDCFGDFCARNAAARGEWRVDGTRIFPQMIAAPAYVVVPGLDRIVPPESSLPLARALPHAALHQPMLGHIGIMASNHAPQQVWQPLAAWLAGH